MSPEENILNTSGEDATPVEVAEPAEPLITNKAISALYAEVSEIAKDAPTIRKRVVTALAEIDLTEKVNMLTKAFSKHKELKKALDQIKPTQTFDESGKVLSSSFDKATFESRKKAQEAFNKFEKAFTKALEKNDFGELKNVCK